MKSSVKPATAIIVSVSLFVILDLSVLALNFHIAKQIDEDSLAINLAGRQRMLTQQMAKQILEQQTLPAGSIRRQTLEQAFQESYALFDTTLSAFVVGGEVMDSEGQPAYLRARDDSALKPLLLQAVERWQIFRSDLPKLKQDDHSLPIALQSGDDLLSTVNQLTAVLEHQARDKAALLRLFQSIAVIVVLLNFGVILWQVRCRFHSVAKNNLMLYNLVDKMSTAVLLVNDHSKIYYANRAAGFLFGCQPEQLNDKSHEDLFHNVEDKLIGQRSDGSNFTAHMEISELIFDDNLVQIITITDITRQQEVDSHIRHLAYHDFLTGLPNRLLFEQRIKRDLSAAKRHGEFIVLLTIDLDNFKLINDNFGHLIGDEVLRIVAQRFRDAIRSEDLIARLGGDEFVVVLTRFKSEAVAKQAAQDICSILLEAIFQPVVTIQGEIAVGGSIGVSFYPIDGDELADIMSQSDASMYRAKSKGLGCEILRHA